MSSSINSAIEELYRFKGHQLEDLNKAKLMNRIDNKFLLPLSQLPSLLQKVNTYYTALEIGGQRLFTYENYYYDCDELQFYHAHHNGKLNRYKVRYRNYRDSALSFLEVKFKNNKKRTNKQRVQVTSSPEEAIKEQHDFLKETGIVMPQSLKVVQEGSYQRIALANEAAAERLTIDIDLCVSSDNGATSFQLEQYAIAELKQAKLNRFSPFYQLMRDNQLRPTGFSKYCMGMALTQGDKLKINRFLPTIRKLKLPTQQGQNLGNSSIQQYSKKNIAA